MLTHGIVRSIEGSNETMKSISCPFYLLRWAAIRPERRLRVTIQGGGGGGGCGGVGPKLNPDNIHCASSVDEVL